MVGVRNLSNFDEILVEATDNALASTVGVPIAQAIKFYMDVSLVSKDIDKFRSQLNKFVSSSKLVESKIISNLATSLDSNRATSLSTEDTSDLKRFVENCRSEYFTK